MIIIIIIIIIIITVTCPYTSVPKVTLVNELTLVKK